MRVSQRLSGLDASFLYLETATQPLHVISVLELDTSTIPGGYDYDRFRADLSARLGAMSAFREKPSTSVLNLDHPVWVEDSDVDLDRHVRRIALPAPGGRAEFDEICGYLAGLPLDRRRPVWEMWVVEGAGGSLGSGWLAVIIKLHHAAADGVTFVKVLSQLCSRELDPPPPDRVEAIPADKPARIAADGLARFAIRPLYLVVRLLPATFRAVVDTVRRAAGGRAMAAPFTAPRTVLNGSITADRKVALARLDLADVKKVKNHFGVTVNDVVVALVGGVVRQFLVDRGELPKSSLVAMVPVSAHEPSNSPSTETRFRDCSPDCRRRSRTLPSGSGRSPRRMSSRRNTVRRSVSRLLRDWFEIIGPVFVRYSEAGVRAPDPLPAHVQRGCVQRAESAGTLLPGGRDLDDDPGRASPVRFGAEHLAVDIQRERSTSG